MSDESAIQVFESFVGVRLPDQYRNFLLNSNAERPKLIEVDIPGQSESLIQYLFPLTSKAKTDVLPYKLKLYKDRMPHELLPIGADPGGNVIALGIKGQSRGKVVFWDHEREADDEPQPYFDNVTELAADFQTFLDNLH